MSEPVEFVRHLPEVIRCAIEREGVPLRSLSNDNGDLCIECENKALLADLTRKLGRHGLYSVSRSRGNKPMLRIHLALLGFEVFKRGGMVQDIFGDNACRKA